MKHKHDKNTAKLRNWLGSKTTARVNRLKRILKEKKATSHGITNVLAGQDFIKLRKELVTTLKIN